MPPAAALAIVPARPAAGLTLYEIEEHLAALCDTEQVVPPELQAEFEREFQATLAAAEEKRDAVSRFMGHLESQLALADKEIARIEALKVPLRAKLERLTGLVVKAIMGLGKDAKGKWRKLEGSACVLSLRKCPDSVNVTDETAVPEQFTKFSFRIPSSLWERLLDDLTLELRAELLGSMDKPGVDVSKTLIKQAFEAGQSVPGAALVTDKFALVRK